MAVVPVLSTPTPYTSGWAWIEECRNYLTGGVKPQLNKLQSAMDETATTLTVQYALNQPTVGGVISVGLETMLVWDFNATGNTVVVERGYAGTEAEAHDAGDLVFVDPRFTTARIWRQLQNEVAALGSEGLWRVDIIEDTFDVNLGGIDLSSVMLTDQIISVSLLPDGMDGEWQDIQHWQVLTGLSTDVYASGNALFFPNGGPSGADTIRVTYKGALDPLADVEENPVDATGIPPTAADIPPIGAAVRLLAGEPVVRADPSSSPTQRPPGETSTSDLVNSGNALRALRSQRLAQEIQRLSGRYAVRLPSARL